MLERAKTVYHNGLRSYYEYREYMISERDPGDFLSPSNVLPIMGAFLVTLTVAAYLKELNII